MKKVLRQAPDRLPRIDGVVKDSIITPRPSVRRFADLPMCVITRCCTAQPVNESLSPSMDTYLWGVIVNCNPSAAISGGRAA